jgi:hypothetical protein
MKSELSMRFQNLTRRQWDKYDRSEKTRYAEELPEHLKLPFSFERVKTFLLRGQQASIAIFEFDGAAFALIPGGRVRLGFHGNLFRPTRQQIESYRESAEEYGFSENITSFIRETCTTPRTVTINAMLAEVRPTEIGLERISADNPEVLEVLKRTLKEPERIGGARVIEIHKTLRLALNSRGVWQAWRIVETTHKQVTEQLSAQGFRLPSSDEWEYLCGAGSKTLFRWGNSSPCNCYPIDKNAWSKHKKPNLFGLQIAQNPYECEVVAEPNVLRGGDGGCSICGGSGFFLGWLPLATAYLDPNVNQWLEQDRSNLFLRRVYPLDAFYKAREEGKRLQELKRATTTRS